MRTLGLGAAHVPVTVHPRVRVGRDRYQYPAPTSAAIHVGDCSAKVPDMTRTAAGLCVGCGVFLLAVFMFWWLAPVGSSAPHGAGRDFARGPSPVDAVADESAVSVKHSALDDQAQSAGVRGQVRRSEVVQRTGLGRANEPTAPPLPTAESFPSGASPVDPSPPDLPQRNDRSDPPGDISAQQGESGRSGLAAALESDPLAKAFRASVREIIRNRGPVAEVYWDYSFAMEDAGGRLPETEAKEWFSRLRSIAEQFPDDPAAPDALFDAALLAEHVEPGQALELYRAVAEHPLVGHHRRVTAMFCVSRCAEQRRDIRQAFEALNDVSLALDELEASGEDCSRDRFLVLVGKSAILQHCRLLRVPVPPLPAPDTGKRESDFVRELVAWHADKDPQDHWQALRHLADALAAEQQIEEAACVFKQLRNHPGNPGTPFGTAIAEAERLDPEHGRRYITILESAERDLPRGPGWHRLNYRIAEWHRRHGNRGEWLARIEPLIDSADPEDYAWVYQDDNLYGTLLYETACVYMGRKFLDHDRAHALFSRLLSEVPDHPSAESARELLDKFIERNRSLKSVEFTQGRNDGEE